MADGSDEFHLKCQVMSGGIVFTSTGYDVPVKTPKHQQLLSNLLRDKKIFDNEQPYCMRILMFTLPQTNKALEHRPLEKEIPIGNQHF